MQIWFNSLHPREGEIVVTASRARLAGVSGPLTNPTTLAVEVPAATRNFAVRIADKAVGASVSAVRLVPLGPLPTGLARTSRCRAIEALPGRERAYIVYTDEHTFPKAGRSGLRGTRRARVWITPAGATRMTLTVSTGPLTGDVFLKTAAGSRARSRCRPASRRR